MKYKLCKFGIIFETLQQKSDLFFALYNLILINVRIDHLERQLLNIFSVSAFSTPKLKEYESAEFTITGEIGVGSFSIVLRCRNRKLDETVAVKVFGLTGSHIGIERKLNE